MRRTATSSVVRGSEGRGSICASLGESVLNYGRVKAETEYSTPQRSNSKSVKLEEEIENVSTTAERFSNSLSPFENGLIRNSAFTVITPRHERGECAEEAMAKRTG